MNGHECVEGDDGIKSIVSFICLVLVTLWAPLGPVSRSIENSRQQVISNRGEKYGVGIGRKNLVTWR